MKNQLNQSIEQGISYLEDHQLPNGEFLFYMSLTIIDADK